jgi:hypothetical protein
LLPQLEKAKEKLNTAANRLREFIICVLFFRW